jgi:anti-sigma B factor antagonist
MKFRITSDTKATIIQFQESRLDAMNAPKIKYDLAALSKNHQFPFILDLTDVSFIDSSALGALVNLLKTLGNDNLMICGASGMVKDLFSLTRMDKIFNLRSDLEDSLESIVTAS